MKAATATPTHPRNTPHHTRPGRIFASAITRAKSTGATHSQMITNGTAA
jgi:hypothetical protein